MTALADILLHAKSAFPTSLWVMQEVVQCREQRNGVPRYERVNRERCASLCSAHSTVQNYLTLISSLSPLEK
jgi:hypothetical protein